MKSIFKVLALVSLLMFALVGCNSKEERRNNDMEDNQNTVINQAEISVSEKNPNLAIRVSEEEDHYIFELAENVQREKVYFKNRFGIEIAGDLYYAKDIDKTQKYPAIVIAPPFGGVKEQGPGVYANGLAQRGFIALAIDPAFHGYSGGETRYTASTEMYSEDFSAGVDFLGMQEYVDREKIAAIGICGGGGFALGAAAMDGRIKAVVTSVMYDIAGIIGSSTGEARATQLKDASYQRWTDIENGEAAIQKSYPDEPVTEVPEMFKNMPNMEEFFTFYGMERGWHPNALANITVTSGLSLMTFPSTLHIKEISPRPILFIAGENAHSRAFSEEAYANANEPKELYIVPDAIHIDLYDDTSKIPFEKIESFLNDAFSN